MDGNPLWNSWETKISKYFTTKEVLWLPSWKRLATPMDGLNDDVWSSLTTFAVCHMDEVREFLGMPIKVHCWYRPPNYNRAVGGAVSSAHQALGDWAAVDFHCDVQGAKTQGESCDILRASLLPQLEKFGLRMENTGKGSHWVHLDSMPPTHTRFFRP